MTQDQPEELVANADFQYNRGTRSDSGTPVFSPGPPAFPTPQAGKETSQCRVQTSGMETVDLRITADYAGTESQSAGNGNSAASLQQEVDILRATSSSVHGLDRWAAASSLRLASSAAKTSQQPISEDGVEDNIGRLSSDDMGTRLRADRHLKKRKGHDENAWVRRIFGIGSPKLGDPGHFQAS